MGEKRKADDAKHSLVTKIAKFELENSEGDKKLGWASPRDACLTYISTWGLSFI